MKIHPLSSVLDLSDRLDRISYGIYSSINNQDNVFSAHAKLEKEVWLKNFAEFKSKASQLSIGDDIINTIIDKGIDNLPIYTIMSAIDILTIIDNEKSLDLIKVILNKATDVIIKIHAIACMSLLTHANNSHEVVDLIVNIFNSEYVEDIKYECIRSLCRIKRDDSRDFLDFLSNNKDVKYFTAYAVEFLDYLPKDKDILSNIILNNNDNDTIKACINKLKETARDLYIDTAFDLYEKLDKKSVKILLVRSLAYCNDSRVENGFLNILGKSKIPKVDAVCLAYLLRNNSEFLSKAVDYINKNPAIWFYLRDMRAFKEINDERIVKILIECFLNIKSKTLRSAAVYAISDSKHSSIHEFLLNHIQEETSPLVIKTCISQIIKTADDITINKLKAMIEERKLREDHIKIILSCVSRRINYRKADLIARIFLSAKNNGELYKSLRLIKRYIFIYSDEALTNILLECKIIKHAQKLLNWIPEDRKRRIIKNAFNFYKKSKDEDKKDRLEKLIGFGKIKQEVYI
ncbi:MAG: hypothetical protein NZM04_05285 [Methylacidiphilales bacterium]|nr:hypothetical protein [Candidatus Methylacidiphilales bacterium]